MIETVFISKFGHSNNGGSHLIIRKDRDVRMTKKLGLCLTGGGARGGYQIGAMKALKDLGILERVEVFSGTSIGAANATVVASRSIEEAEKVWLNLPDDNIPKQTPKENGKKLFRLPDFENGIYSMEVFRSVMADAIDFDALKRKRVYVTVSLAGEKETGIGELLRSSYTHYLRGSSQVRYMETWKMDNEAILDSVIASSSIPMFFSPVKIENYNCYDGGVFDNVPVQPLIDSGCDEIVIIHLHRYKTKFFKTNKYPDTITFHEIKHTGKELGKVLKFTKSQTEKLIDLGYRETMDYFKTVPEYAHLIRTDETQADSDARNMDASS